MDKIDNDAPDLATIVDTLSWYHTIDLGNGLVTKGHYDHRPYLNHYNLPTNLSGKTVLDIGAASGFFSFEFEQRGAQVTSTELRGWVDHDFGPKYEMEQDLDTIDTYLYEPFDIAHRALNSQVKRKYINVYDISPESVGLFDIVFCGSVLIHLTDPLKALWNIASVTKEKAIIAASIDPTLDHAVASMIGYQRGDAWWIPTRSCLELMAVSVGFVGIEWVSDFPLNYRDQDVGPYHGVLHAYKTTEGWTPETVSSQDIVKRNEAQNAMASQTLQNLTQRNQELETEIAQAHNLITQYEQGRFMRLMRWLKGNR